MRSSGSHERRCRLVLPLTTSLIGPLGLYLAFKFVVLEQPMMRHTVMLVFGALAVWTLIGNIIFVLTVASPGYELRGIFLMALLPIAGAAHRIYMARSDPGELVTA